MQEGKVSSREDVVAKMKEVVAAGFWIGYDFVLRI